MENKLKERRKNLGLSVEQVAERMIEPFRQTYIELIKDNERQNRLENDDLPEDQSWDKLLAKALECKIEDLIWTQKKPELTKFERNTIYNNLLYYFRSVILYHTDQ